MLRPVCGWRLVAGAGLAWLLVGLLLTIRRQQGAEQGSRHAHWLGFSSREERLNNCFCPYDEKLYNILSGCCCPVWGDKARLITRVMGARPMTCFSYAAAGAAMGMAILGEAGAGIGFVLGPCAIRAVVSLGESTWKASYGTPYCF